MRQLVGIFLIILIAGSSAASVQSKLGHKQQIIGDIQNKNSKFYALLEEGSQFVVDEVLSLLQNLEDAARKDLADLNAAWAEQKALLEGIQESAKVAWSTQQAECNRLEAEQHDLENKINVRVQETNGNNGVIADDSNKIQTMKVERCNSNNLYVDHIIDHRDAILLFGVLRKAIEGYQPGSFVQLSKFKQNVATLGDFINIFAQQHSKEFQQIMSQLRQVSDNFQGSNAEAAVNDFAANAEYQQVGRVQNTDTGAGSQDNDKNQIKLDDLSQQTVRDLANVKGQLLKVLDDLTEVEQQKKATQENEEANSNEAAATFKSQLQDEQRRLTRRNEVLAVEIQALQVQLQAKVVEVNKCREQEATLLAAYQLAQQQLLDATNRYNQRSETLQNEIVLFNRLALYYKDKVYAVASEADKQRVDDEVRDGKFDTTESYTHHTTQDQVDAQAGRVEEQTHAQAVADGSNEDGADYADE